jgi:prophage regulatory protein
MIYENPAPKERQPRLIRLGDVIDKVGIQKTAIYRLIQSGEPKFPAPIKLGGASRWLEGEIDDWIAESIARQRKAG